MDSAGEKNEKLWKAGESDRISFINRTEYYSLSWCFVNISYCHYNQQEKLENNYKTSFWKSQHFFFKKQTYTHARTLPFPLVRFYSIFNEPLPPLLNKRTFWLTPYFCQWHIKFQLTKFRRFISHDTVKWLELWRKTDFSFEKWHEEFGEL